MGLSGLVLQEDLKPKQREILLGVHSSAHDLLGLVNDLLDISRIEAGMMRLDAAPFRLRALADSILAPFRFEAERKRLDLHLEIESQVPDVLSGDSIRLKQVLTNLLGNAFKFTDVGGVALRIRKQGGAPAGSARLLFEVEDTGIGIPASARSGVFKPFNQVDGSTSRKHEGAGLGLYISRQIVERMGGTIDYRSQPGRGSVFHFTAEFPVVSGAEAAALPFGNPVPAFAPVTARPPASAPSQAPAQATEAAKPSAPREPLEGMRVLIVEDHVLNRKVLSGMLASRGVMGDEAPGGIEALEALSRKPYRIIFTDLHMPGMDGFELTGKVRELGMAPSPIIVGVTADAMAETRARLIQGGMDDVLTKPILARDLEALLGRLAARFEAGPPKARESAEAAKPDPEPESESTWIDARHVSELDEWVRNHDATFWTRATSQFRLDVSRLSEAVRAAIEEGNRSDAGEAAHSLKGVALMLGFQGIGRKAKQLEDLIRDGKGAAWSGKLKEIEEAVEPSLEELRAKFEQGASEPA
jgi:CheY-like chemotaxis protein